MHSKIEQARERLEKAKAEFQKHEKRRHMIIGEAIGNAIANGRFTEDQLTEFLNEYVTRVRDREFLGLSVERKAD